MTILAALLLAQTTAAAAPAATPANPAPAPVVWTGTVTLGALVLTGNSETVTFSTTGAFERKTEDWIFGVKFAGAYGRSTAPATGVSDVTALLGSIAARGDRRFSDTLSLYLLAGVETDHLKSIEARPAGEIGVGMIWIDDKVGDLQKQQLRTDLGLRAGKEYRFQYYPTPMDQPDVDILAPRVGVAYRYAFNKDVIFTEDASVLPNVIGDTQGRVLVSSTTKLSSRLSGKLSLGVGYVVNFDSQPPPTKVKTDTALTVGLEVGI